MKLALVFWLGFGGFVVVAAMIAGGRCVVLALMARGV